VLDGCALVGGKLTGEAEPLGESKAARWAFGKPGTKGAPRRSAGKAAMGFIGPEGRKQLQLAARFASAGLELALAIVVGYFGGRFLDGRLGTAPYLAYAGLILGVVAGFRNLFQLARGAQRQAERTSNDPPHDSSP
jgi:ATP synthase protein I